MMRIHVTVVTVLIIIIKVSLRRLRFYCFINGKIKKEPKNLELDINIAKTGDVVT